MLSRTLAIFSIFLIITKSSDSAPAVAKPRQFLPAISGYIPVYIREGDTPLEDIHPDLAEAFNGYSQKYSRRPFSSSSNNFGDKENENNTKFYGHIKENGKDNSVDSDFILETKNYDETSPKLESRHYLHIQKISRS